MNQQLFTAALPARDPAGARRAALLLHALAPVDRDWMLAQLSAPQRATLEPLLTDLEILGIPPDPELFREVLQAPATAPAAPASLAQADPRILADVLKDEPVGLTVQLLACGPWPWAEALRGHLGPALRRQVEACQCQVATPGPILRELLLAGVAERLSRHPGMPVESLQPGPPTLTPRWSWARWTRPQA